MDEPEGGPATPTGEPRRRGRPPRGDAQARADKPARAPKPARAVQAQSFEATLWAAADKLRNNVDPAEYKHVVLGLIFLKFISDSFESYHAFLVRDAADPNSERYMREEAARYSVAEERDEYTAERIFWVPPEARWSALQQQARDPRIGALIDAAMLAIERENEQLKGVLPKDYARPSLDQTRLGELVDLVGRIGLGDEASRSQDVLGRVYEYFLSRFASAEGKGGGEFYTPQPVVRLLVELLEPYRGKVYDPCCGSGGMFVQSEKFVLAHGGRLDDLSIYGQESNPTTWRLCKMNLAIRRIDHNLGPGHADSFHNDLHKDLRADFILANPPFNISDWGGERLAGDVRWRYGAPPAGNANYAWVQHIIHHLSAGGRAGFVLANGSMSSNQSGEGEIRKALVNADLVDCMVALPGQLFYTTQIPVCLWFLARDKSGGRGGRDRRGHTLFVDARRLGVLEDRTHRVLTDAEIAQIAETYHAWRGPDPEAYRDVPGFCKSATLAEIASHGFVLTPGRYVGAAEAEQEDEPFEQKFARLTAELEQQFAESRRLEEVIRESLRGLENGK
ncbi:MAG TPA: class I SAM-dependent DNA methyltransferase [Roseiflexaceae bacterium]|nr:class I SAM-dependent DNA methyltransferase [Roseiflexaceae bacterium]